MRAVELESGPSSLVSTTSYITKTIKLTKGTADEHPECEVSFLGMTWETIVDCLGHWRRLESDSAFGVCKRFRSNGAY